MTISARLKSEFWVQAFLRRCDVAGMFGAVIYKGAEEAGAVYVVLNRLDGTYDLLSPPPGPAYNEQGERCFIFEASVPHDWPSMNDVLQRRRLRDSDLWIIEVECRTGFADLNILLDA